MYIYIYIFILIFIFIIIHNINRCICEKAERSEALGRRHLFDVFHCQVQYDGDLDIEIDEEDLKMDGPLLDKLRD